MTKKYRVGSRVGWGVDNKIKGECHGKRGDEHTSSAVRHEKEKVVHTSNTTTEMERRTLTEP